MPNYFNFPRLVFSLLLTLVMTPAMAAELLVLVSDRSTPVVVAAAHRHLATHPDHSVVVRSVSQLNELDEEALHTLAAQSNAVLMLGVFGDVVERLHSLNWPASQHRYVLHSDRRLLALHRDRHGAIFSKGIPESVVGDREAVGDPQRLRDKQQSFAPFRDWLQARAYWVNRSVANTQALLALAASAGAEQAPVQDVAPLRFALHQPSAEPRWLTAEQLPEVLARKATAWIVDHDSGDLAGEWQLHRELCRELAVQCVSVLAAWGQASVEAIATIQQLVSGHLQGVATGVLALQDFVIGGGEGRAPVTDLLAAINVPVLKGVRLGEWSGADYRLSPEGIPRQSVHYRVAMPELQGVSQPVVLALADDARIDPVTGARVANSVPQTAEVARQARRLRGWLNLSQKANGQKRLAIVYYNHPPGRHNIGADNLNVPESLLEILRGLKAAGYDTGTLPKDADALLDILQARGVNLPEDAAALARMSREVATMSAEGYGSWFATLPAAVQAEMRNGPLAALDVRLRAAAAEAQKLRSNTLRQSRLDMLQDNLHNAVRDLHHALDGLRHPGRERALALLEQLEVSYQRAIDQARAGAEPDWSDSEPRLRALLAMGIEGIRGWGEVPGKVMVWEKQLLIPGVQFGKIFVGPQPPRGWEINEELLHANLSFPPPHQYLAFYHHIQHTVKADAVIHLGRHSTYEFLPRRSLGLSADDYPSIVAGDLPGLYPYIVDGVGEGIQAKRRGLAVMIDHLTPPLAITELYDELLELRQLIESAEAATDDATRDRAIVRLRRVIDEAGLREELIASMDEELQVRGVGFDDIDEDFLLHEVGHYLTKLQESFMPLGLHVFGRDWSDTAVDTMLASMRDGDAGQSDSERWREDLRRSPAAEMAALLNGLNGGFVAPGKGNDPIRTPEALPTGRNFYALDGSLLPTRTGYDIGQQLAARVLSGEDTNIEGHQPGERNKQGVILWASDAVRDEGAMIAFGLKLLGVRPVWNSRGIIKGLERLPLGKSQPRRLDVLFTTSGLFRDLYGEHLVLLERASLMALAASRDTIVAQYPALALALRGALAPLGDEYDAGQEPLEHNLVAANWVNEARAMLRAQPEQDGAALGRQASLRVFGIAPGAYGAGVNRLAERSSAWQERRELADVFIQRMGHVYGSDLAGESAQNLFRQQLAGVSQTYLGRASNLYGLIDNNDAFDYLGGLNLAVEAVTGSQPGSAVINHADNRKLRIESLSEALLGELRGRFLNPQWIKPLMDEGYAGARTMGSEFVEYLWGWQVTSPEIVNDRVWEEVKAVYIDDRLDLGVDTFLAEGHRRHVQSNILAIMLVAIDKGFWNADATARQQLAEQFATNIIEGGLPGSGHTHPDHPMYDLVKSLVTPEQAAALEQVLARSRIVAPSPASNPSRIRQLEINDAPAQDAADGESTASAGEPSWLPLLFGLALIIAAAGVWRGRRGG